MRITRYLKAAVIILIFFLPLVSVAQSMREIKPMVNMQPKVIIDYGSEDNAHTKVPFKGEIMQQSESGRTTEVSAAVFEVTYIDFGQTQQAAFQHAVDIWASLLQSDVTIHITAQMSSLTGGTLGQTTIPARYANFDNAQKINSFYTVAMAEKMAGHDLNDPADPDIIMEFNSDFNFYYGTDLNTPSGMHDFVTIVLHEIAHGLGFSDGTFETQGTGFYTVFGAPTVYDRHLENGLGENLIDTYDDNSTELGDELTGNDLFFNSFEFPTIDDRPKVYAPAAWNSGSSIAHLDEATYPEGDSNSLMTPQISAAEAIHDPGITLAMFQDMGWVAMIIDHDLFLDSEDSVSNRTLTAIVKGDSAVLTDGVNLHYSYDEFGNEVVVGMTSTGNANEYTAIIKATGNEEQVSYFVNVDAQGGRAFTSPGEAPDFFWQFVMAKDTIAPEIEHLPLSIVFLNNAVLPVSANVLDNIGVGDLKLTYKVNGGAIKSFIVPLFESDINGSFEGKYELNWDIAALGVVQGDLVEYKLEIDDVAAKPNSTAHPETGFHQIQVEDINNPVARYENNFNAPTSDFVGSGFTTGPESGFDSDAIHSDHPYKTVDGVTPADTLILIYMLKTPIILSDKDASLNFDEVLILEPGVDGTEFGDDQFWDYVIIEGSNNLGLSWQPLADGYDSRAHDVWLERWNSDVDADGNSLAIGESSLFIGSEIDMTANGNFVAGDTLLIRFRLYADQLAHGWGWAIDNLRIQIDEKAPVITQITPDYLLVGDTEIILNSKVEDNTELDSVVYEIRLNSGQSQFLSLPGTAGLYNVTLSFSPAVSATDVFEYRIIAVDKSTNPNTTILPLTGFFEVPVAQLGAVKSMYINDFNAPTDDFIGSHFSIAQPDKFTDPAMISPSPYPDAPFETWDISYLLKYPITLNQNSAWVQWDEMVLVEPGVDKVAFEVSKDEGRTWIAVFDAYDASAETSWANIFSKLDEDGNSTGIGEPLFMEHRFFNILNNPEINGGDEVLVRFRMTVNDNLHGWGWIIDNLEIQGITTGIEDNFSANIQIYPNPTNTGRVVLSGTLKAATAKIFVTNMLGKVVLQRDVIITNNSLRTTLDISELKKGIYLISVSAKSGVYTSRVIIE